MTHVPWDGAVARASEGDGAAAPPPEQVFRAPCKVNLHLGIHEGRDARGYHRADSVMVPLALADTLTVCEAPELRVRHEPALGVAPGRTTVWRAATLLAEALGVAPQVEVHVDVRIPERAGLGGSSADAGATLRALAGRWGVAPTDPRVVDVARRVGADVAFFLDPAPALMVGAGDVLAERFPALVLPVALVLPAAEGVGTREAYDEFDRAPEAPADFGPLCAALREGRADDVPGLLANNLAPAARRLSPAVAEAEAWLRAQPGVLAAQVTGSGGCSFALCESDAAARAVADGAAARGWWSCATHTCG